MYIENRRMGIRINLLVPTGFVIVFLLNGVLSSFVMLLAAIVHEAGHVLCAYAVRAPILRFDVELWGGRMLYGGMLSYKQEMFIAMGGMIANLIFSPLGLIPIFGIYGKLFYYSCICYALVNMIPAKTLDGGELLRCFLLQCSDRFTADRAERAMHMLSVLFMIIAGIFFSVLSGFNSSVMFIILFSIILLVMEAKKAWC